MTNEGKAENVTLCKKNVRQKLAILRCYKQQHSGRTPASYTAEHTVAKNNTVPELNLNNLDKVIQRTIKLACKFRHKITAEEICVLSCLRKYNDVNITYDLKNGQMRISGVIDNVKRCHNEVKNMMKAWHRIHGATLSSRFHSLSPKLRQTLLQEPRQTLVHIMRCFQYGRRNARNKMSGRRSATTRKRRLRTERFAGP